MPIDFRAHENGRRAKAKRQYAMERNELRTESVPRESAAGPTSHAIKINPDAGAIEAFLAARIGDTRGDT